MWELDHKEGWALKNWCFQTVVLKRLLRVPLDCKEIRPVNPKGNKPWMFIGRTDAEAPILWPPDANSQLTGKDPDAGKGWGQEKKEAAEDEMLGWHHWLKGCEFEQTPEHGEGQGSLVCCSPWGRRVGHDLVPEQHQPGEESRVKDQQPLVGQAWVWVPALPLDESESEVAQSCPTLGDPMDSSPPGSFVHAILQARILDWVAISWEWSFFVF